MSIFDAYNQEFNSLCQEITKNISELKMAPNTEVDKVSGLVQQVGRLLSQATELIKQMEVEVRSHDPATRKVLLEKVAQYKKSMLSHRADFESAKEKAQRSALIGTKSIEHRQKYLEVNDKLARQNEMIANSIRTVNETEDVGNEIAAELSRNREKIESSHAKVRDFSGLTDQARRVLSSMARRDIKQKFILVFIAAVLIVAIAVTAYYTTRKNK